MIPKLPTGYTVRRQSCVGGGVHTPRKIAPVLAAAGRRRVYIGVHASADCDTGGRNPCGLSEWTGGVWSREHGTAVFSRRAHVRASRVIKSVPAARAYTFRTNDSANKIGICIRSRTSQYISHKYGVARITKYPTRT